MLDYANVSTRMLCFETSLEFHFTDETLLSLMKLLVTFPQQDHLEDANLPTLKFGHTVNTCSYTSIKNLLKLTYGRVIVNLDGMDAA